MLNLTGTKASLLKIFFTNPEQEFYMHEIGRILGKKPGTFQRALNGLADSGILKSASRGNARFFQANPNHPLFDEIKSIIFKTVGVLGSLKGILLGAGGVEFAFIYGSFAKGKENSLSDIDLLIVGDPDEDRIVEALDRLEAQLKREINFKLLTRDDFLSGLHRHDAFLREILKDRIIMVIGGEDGLRRMAAGSPHQRAETE